MVHIERPVKDLIPAIVPIEFQEHLPRFAERFTSSLKTPPMGMLYQETTGWNPRFSQVVKKVDEVCKQQEICAHGLDNHLLYVAQNAFALTDAIPQHLRSSLHNDSHTTFLSLTHDLGYANDSVVWKDKDALLHEEKSAEWIHNERSLHEVPTPHTDHFDNHSQLFTSIITANTDYKGTLLPLAQEIATNPTPEGLLFLSFCMADKLDFFRSSRLEGIQRPLSYAENPYFFLADAVERYSITSDDSHLYYTVQMNNADFEAWKAQVQEHYGWIFDLGNIFGKAIGKEFVIQQG